MTVMPPYSNLNFLAWPAGHGLDWHRHGEFQVIHVLDGELEIDWGNGWRSHQAGDAHVLPPGVAHRTRTIHGHGQLGLNFTPGDDPRGIIAGLRQAFPGAAQVRLEAGSFPLAEIRAAADGVLSLEDLRRPGGARLGPAGEALSQARLRLYAVLDLYCLALMEAAAPRRGSLAQRLLEHLATRADQPIAVGDVVRDLAVSRARMQRACLATFGCGLVHLHERLRITRAANLLLAGQLPVAACAERSGYPDVYQFSRAFRRVMGQPPTAYRRKHWELTA